MKENKFWVEVDNILKVFAALVKVLQVVDGYTKPTMGALMMP